MKKQIIVITGGTTGLGKEIAKLFVKKATVLVLSADPRTATIVKKFGAVGFVCDVTKSDQVEKTFAEIYGEYGRVDVLVNNAGVWCEGELEGSSFEDIENVMMVNTLGVMFCTRAILPLMRAQKAGLIVNINSQAGVGVKARRSIYQASKWAITGFTKSLQVDLAGTGVRVTGVYPGKMKTDLFKRVGIEKDLSDAIAPKLVAKEIACLIMQPHSVLISDLGIYSAERT